MDSPPHLSDYDSADETSVRHLQRQISEKNSLIDELEADIQALLNNNYEDSVTAKVADLVKRNRALQLSLDKEKLAHRKTLSELQSSTPQTTPSSPETSQDFPKQRKELQDRNNALLRKIGDQTTLIEKYKSENSKLHRILSKELGNVPLDSLLNDSIPSWRGRKEKIDHLKRQVLSLKERLIQANDQDETESVVSSVSYVSSVTRPEDRASKEIDGYRAIREKVKREKQLEIEELQSEVNQERRRAQAALARVSVLEKEVSEVKASLKHVIIKTKNDDVYITALKTQLASLSDEGQQETIKELQVTRQRLDLMEKKYSTLAAELDLRGGNLGNSTQDTSARVFQKENESLNQLISDLRERLTVAEKKRADCEFEIKRMLVKGGVSEEVEFQSTTADSVLMGRIKEQLEEEVLVYKRLLSDVHLFLNGSGEEKAQLLAGLQQELIDSQSRCNEMFINTRQ
ncbi:hypothetical protein GEMRC1_006353 [Eukaryota sp. GEM-RC1]